MTALVGLTRSPLRSPVRSVFAGDTPVISINQVDTSGFSYSNSGTADVITRTAAGTATGRMYAEVTGLQAGANYQLQCVANKNDASGGCFMCVAEDSLLSATNRAYINTIVGEETIDAVVVPSASTQYIGLLVTSMAQDESSWINHGLTFTKI